MSSLEWADAGASELREWLRDEQAPLPLERASLYIRAAYIRGYQDALEQAEPLTIPRATAFRDELALRVPVS